ncbi:MAG: NADPH:quinone oxidoreductase family protein [Parasphingopyxis sp.]|uniref:NADPH:quinone oxidoreductase family protein n=1 Tax=Parasphingopyxis sp. TaxID=1920299 RepID=UPI0032EFC20B
MEIVSRAVMAGELGPVENYRLVERSVPAPAKGEVTVRVAASGISFVDLLLSRGSYQVKPPVPYIPGTEFAGTIEAVGSGVADLSIGDRVLGSGMGGGFADHITLDAASLTACPSDMAFDEAACFRVNYTTAYHALLQRAGLRAGETVLVLGAAGGVGIAAVQIAKAFGARVVAVASTQEKRALAESAGADVAIAPDENEWREHVREAAGGAPVDVVVDPVGGELTEWAFRCLGWGGRHLVIGFAAGTIPALRSNLALLKGAALVGVDIRQFNLLEPAKAAQNWRGLLELRKTDDLDPRIGRKFPLIDYAKAMECASDARNTGRIVLIPQT